MSHNDIIDTLPTTVLLPVLKCAARYGKKNDIIYTNGDVPSETGHWHNADQGLIFDPHNVLILITASVLIILFSSAAWSCRDLFQIGSFIFFSLPAFKW